MWWPVVFLGFWAINARPCLADEQTLERFRQLCPTNSRTGLPLLQGSEATQFFYHTLTTSQRESFQMDVRKWKYGLIAYRINYKSMGLPNQPQLWRRPTSEELQDFQFSDRLPFIPGRLFFNEDHPSVQTVLEQMPCFTPAIMFCACPPLATRRSFCDLNAHVGLD